MHSNTEFNIAVVLTIGENDDSLQEKLEMVAKLIALRDQRGNGGINREVFFLEVAGYDHHAQLNYNLKTKLPALNSAIENFW